MLGTKNPKQASKKQCPKAAEVSVMVFHVTATNIQPVRRTDRSALHTTSVTTMDNYDNCDNHIQPQHGVALCGSAWFQRIQHLIWGTRWLHAMNLLVGIGTSPYITNIQALYMRIKRNQTVSMSTVINLFIIVEHALCELSPRAAPEELENIATSPDE